MEELENLSTTACGDPKSEKPIFPAPYPKYHPLGSGFRKYNTSEQAREAKRKKDRAWRRQERAVQREERAAEEADYGSEEDDEEPPNIVPRKKPKPKAKKTTQKPSKTFSYSKLTERQLQMLPDKYLDNALRSARKQKILVNNNLQE